MFNSIYEIVVFCLFLFLSNLTLVAGVIAAKEYLDRKTFERNLAASQRSSEELMDRLFSNEDVLDDPEPSASLSILKYS